MATISKSLPILCNRSLTLQSCKQIKCITHAHNFGSDAKDNYSQVISIIQFIKNIQILSLHKIYSFPSVLLAICYFFRIIM